MSNILVKSGALVVVATSLPDARALKARLLKTSMDPVEVCYSDGSVVPPDILHPDSFSGRLRLDPRNGKV